MEVRIRPSVMIRLALVIGVVLTSVVLVSAPKPAFSPKDKAFYADPNLVNFVRPGLVVNILSASIAQDGTISAVIKFTDPQGLPLDKDGVNTPGVVAPGIIAAYIPKGATQYTAYTTRSQTSPITSRTAIQAGTDSGGKWSAQAADGSYTYTFATKAPTGFDRTVTHTIGVYANRNLTAFDLGIQLADATFNFVPDGSKVTVTRDVIRTQTCNKCHDNLHLHGNTGRKSVQVCVLCHQPQSVDPDTGNTVDFKVMIHKIHDGDSLPSVLAGKPYQIIGNAQSVNDYSTVAFPSDIRNCTVCHEQNTGAAQATAYLNPGQVACGSCHDDVNFATGQNHVDLPQVSDNQCANCHIPQGELEFDASIKGAHTVPVQSSSLDGIQFNLIRVTSTNPGQRPVVNFSLKNTKGNLLKTSDFGSVSLILAGPTTDYNAFQVGYVSESALAAPQQPDGSYTYTFTNAIPANAKGTFAIGVEGRRTQILLPGTVTQQSVTYGGANKVLYFSVDGSKVAPRRQVVAIDKCNVCHTRLAAHGDNRNQTEFCVVCHNPVQNDSQFRPASAAPAQSVDFQLMIHKIHSGENLGVPFTIYGFNNSKNDFGDVRYPQDRRNCDACHVNNSEQLPLPATNISTIDLRGYINPSGPTTTACLACHNQLSDASHALSMTTPLGEACAACHDNDAQFSVPKVHTIDVQ